jgi:SPP1 gp7 family putative phage head morphogenesis protein
MATANEIYLNSILRHQVDVRRFTTGEVKRLLKLFEAADGALATRLRNVLPGVRNYETARYEALIESITGQRDKLIGEFDAELKTKLQDFATVEHDYELNLLDDSLPVRLDLAGVAPQTLRSLLKDPFSIGPSGTATLAEWITGLKKGDQQRITGAIRQGILQGEGIDDMVRRIAGTRAAKFSDGILAVTRRQAETVVRTGVNHVSNRAREEVWDANADIMSCLAWNATLDGRTSEICAARDGKYATVGGRALPKNLEGAALVPDGARPPAHPNCRSVMTAVLSDEGVAERMGDRPFVRDSRTRKEREKDFRAEAKAKYGDRWADMSPKERNAAIGDLRRQWTTENVGTVPASTTYSEWISKQPKAFQDEVLGKTKAELFRSGGMKLDQFVDTSGKTLTLKQLGATVGKPKGSMFSRFQSSPVGFDAPDPNLKSVFDVFTGGVTPQRSVANLFKTVEDVGTFPLIEVDQRAAELVKTLSGRMASHLDGRGEKRYSSTLMRMLSNWKSTSSDTHELAIHVQEMAAKEFGTRLNAWQIERLVDAKKTGSLIEQMNLDYAKNYGVSYDDLVRAALRSMYEETQDQFRRQGITEITLYRGVALEDGAPWAMREAMGGKLEGVAQIRGNPLESWTALEETANMFARSMLAGRENAIVAAMRVPVERVFSFNRTGMGAFREAEFILVNDTRMPNTALVRFIRTEADNFPNPLTPGLEQELSSSLASLPDDAKKAFLRALRMEAQRVADVKWKLMSEAEKRALMKELSPQFKKTWKPDPEPIVPPTPKPDPTPPPKVEPTKPPATGAQAELDEAILQKEQFEKTMPEFKRNQELALKRLLELENEARDIRAGTAWGPAQEARIAELEGKLIPEAARKYHDADAILAANYRVISNLNEDIKRLTAQLSTVRSESLPLALGEARNDLFLEEARLDALMKTLAREKKEVADANALIKAAKDDYDVSYAKQSKRVSEELVAEYEVSIAKMETRIKELKKEVADLEAKNFAAGGRTVEGEIKKAEVVVQKHATALEALEAQLTELETQREFVWKSARLLPYDDAHHELRATKLSEWKTISATRDALAKELEAKATELREEVFAALVDKKVGKIKPEAPNGGVMTKYIAKHDVQKLIDNLFHSDLFASYKGYKPPVRLLTMKGRGRENFTDWNSSINMGSSTKLDVFVHEFGHFIEYKVPSVKRLATEYLKRRTQGERLQSLRSLTGMGYKRDEVAWPDKFISPYIGKYYRDGATEVISMGLQYMFNNPAKLYREDKELFDLIVRVISGMIV